MLRNHLLSFCAHEGLRELRQITVDALRELRAEWKLAPRTQQKTIETLRAFLRFCEATEWIEKNPATRIKPPKVEDTPTHAPR